MDVLMCNSLWTYTNNSDIFYWKFGFHFKQFSVSMPIEIRKNVPLSSHTPETTLPFKIKIALITNNTYMKYLHDIDNIVFTIQCYLRTFLNNCSFHMKGNKLRLMSQNNKFIFNPLSSQTTVKWILITSFIEREINKSYPVKSRLLILCIHITLLKDFYRG